MHKAAAYRGNDGQPGALQSGQHAHARSWRAGRGALQYQELLQKVYDSIRQTLVLLDNQSEHI